jgi:hypothetical protein
MKRVYLAIVLLVGILNASCGDEPKAGEEKITYASVTDNGTEKRESRGTILFDEDGIVKYFRKVVPDGMANKLDCEIKVTKVGNEYHVSEELFWGFWLIIEEEKSSGGILLKDESGTIWARCKITENVLEFTWDKDGRIGFIYTFNDNGFKNQRREYQYRGNRFTGLKDLNPQPDINAVYKVTKKSKTKYLIEVATNFADSDVTIEAAVRRKTMTQNAINLCILYQYLYYDCIPFLFGRY